MICFDAENTYLGANFGAEVELCICPGLLEASRRREATGREERRE